MDYPPDVRNLAHFSPSSRYKRFMYPALMPRQTNSDAWIIASTARHFVAGSGNLNSSHDSGEIGSSEGSPFLLLVEDNIALAENLTEILSESGWQVRHVDTISAAYQALSESSPTIILSDIRLPDGSGLELVPFLRNLKRQTPVLLMTGYVEEQKRQKALEDKSCQLLHKPVEMPVLFAQLDFLLENYSSSPTA